MKRRMMLSTNAVTSSISTSEQCWPTSSISSLAKGQRSKPWNTVHIHQAATVEDRMFPSWKCWSLLRKACHVDIDKSMKPMGFWLWRRIFHLLIILSWGNRHGNGISCVAILQSESWNQTCCSWRRLLPMGHIKSTCQDDKEPHGIFRCHLWPPIKLFDSVYVPSVAIVSPTFCVSKRCHKQTFLLQYLLCWFGPAVARTLWKLSKTRPSGWSLQHNSMKKRPNASAKVTQKSLRSA